MYVSDVAFICFAASFQSDYSMLDLVSFLLTLFVVTGSFSIGRIYLCDCFFFFFFASLYIMYIIYDHVLSIHLNVTSFLSTLFVFLFAHKHAHTLTLTPPRLLLLTIVNIFSLRRFVTVSFEY